MPEMLGGDTVMNEWISVKDRLPEKDGYYLISFNLSGGKRCVGFRRFYRECPEMFAPDSSIATHWMPFPEPPSVKIDEEVAEQAGSIERNLKHQKGAMRK